MKCDLCDEEAILISGYHYCARHARGRDRIAIHNIIQDAYPMVTLEKIKQICSEMFGTSSYGFSTFPELIKIGGDLDRGPILKIGPRAGWFAKPQEVYLIEAFEKHLQINHTAFWGRIKGEKQERYYG
jgi:hypothetical protein